LQQTQTDNRSSAIQLHYTNVESGLNKSSARRDTERVWGQKYLWRLFWLARITKSTANHLSP